VDLDGPGEGEVLIEVKAAGLCHSDLSQVAGLRKRTLPVVGGHEGAGIVREVGRGVTNLKPGDHVVMTVATGCAHCRPCQVRPALCENVSASRSQGILPNGARRLSLKGAPLYHYSGVSSFAQYAVSVPNTLIRIDPAIPIDVAAMFGCAVVTGAGSVFNSARVRPGQNVAVLGLGATNHMYQYAHAMLVGEEKAFRGSLMGGGVAERDIPTYLKFFQDGKMPVDRLKSDSIGFDKLNVSLDLLDHGDVVRQILLPNG
jgi:Zn-dependent alcohol dehydrogenase